MTLFSVCLFCASGALASLETLVLNSNAIGDDVMSALASACASGALDKIQFIALCGNLGDSTLVYNAMKERKE